MKKGRLVWLGVGIVLVVLGIAFWQSPKSPNVLALESPPNGALTNFLETEAGITAYAQLPTTINFFYVRDLFQTVEYETEEYLIGSFQLANYPIEDQPHAYIHQDGWVLVYYLRTDPVSKILDWKGYSPGNIPTKFEIAINQVAEALSVPSPDVSYYDFRYPNATTIMFVAESADIDGVADNRYQINLPSSYNYYERSWIMAGYFSWYGSGSYYLNDQRLGYIYYDYGDPTPANIYGYISSNEMVTDVFHTIRLYADDGIGDNEYLVGGLAIVYEE